MSRESMPSHRRARKLLPAGGRCSPNRRRRWQLVPIDRGVGLRDDRPHVRVRGRFAGEVSGVELRNGGVEVVRASNSDDCAAILLVGVDLDEAEHLRAGTPQAADRGPRHRTRLRARRSPRVAMTVAVKFFVPDFGECLRMPAISASRPCRIPAPTTRRRSSVQSSSAKNLRHSVPVAGREVLLEALIARLAAFSNRGRLRMQLLEPCERGVEVCLVEDFAAVAQIAVDREERDLPPLSFKVVLRGPARRVRNDRSDVV